MKQFCTLFCQKAQRVFQLQGCRFCLKDFQQTGLNIFVEGAWVLAHLANQSSICCFNASQIAGAPRLTLPATRFSNWSRVTL